MPAPKETAAPCRDFWSGLVAMGTGPGLWDDWARYFGAGMDLVRPWLAATGRQAASCACPAQPPCGCRHLVCKLKGDLVAACTCAESGACGCPGGIAPVSPAQLQLYELDRLKFAESLRQALRLDLPPGGLRQPRPWIEISLWERARVLAVPGRFTRNPAALLEPSETPCILLTAETPAVSALPPGAAALWLGSVAEPSAGGTWIVRQPLGTILERWPGRNEVLPQTLGAIQRDLAALRTHLKSGPPAPEPVSRSTAREVFDVLRRMETEGGKRRKAPLTQVFRLYCAESLSAQQVARRCGCAKSLVIRRLEELRARLGQDPARLRPASSHLEQVENSLADARARKISRWAAVHELETGED